MTLSLNKVVASLMVVSFPTAVEATVQVQRSREDGGVINKLTEACSGLA
uniref:Uncharacterized protein n=1 Tax=Setaria viridis TaxID=4556 RepID=A0A4U6VYX6_SETVI|nr:hypothetical protein SEVIR_2G307351v2 [Setaria viridis]